MKQLIKWPFALLVRTYQWTIRPLIPPCCRYHPSCSDYALEAIHKHPLHLALWLIAKRLCTCNPWFPGGSDPVP